MQSFLIISTPRVSLFSSQNMWLVKKKPVGLNELDWD